MDSSSALLQVLHQHLLGRGEGMKRFHQTGEDLLELLGVFARRQHEAQRGLGIEAVLEGVISHTLLPSGVRGPVDFWAFLRFASAIRGVTFRVLMGMLYLLVRMGKGANGEMVKRRSRFPRFAIFPFPIFQVPFPRLPFPLFPIFSG